MNYEIHITLEVFDINRFIKDCNDNGVKPVMIETQNYNNEMGQQIMTSSKHNNDDYLNTLGNISNIFKSKYKIIREKVEIQPLPTKNENHIYYESHLRLKLPIGFDISHIKELCHKYNFHLSKNLFKKDNVNIWQMITYRGYDISYNEFNHIINNMVEKLKDINIKCDKIEIEECVYDSLSLHDNNWLNITNFGI